MRGDTFLLTVDREVPGQARGPARHRESIVTGQSQPDLHQFIELFAKAAVAAIHGSRSDPRRVERNRTFVETRLALSIHERLSVRVIVCGRWHQPDEKTP